MFADNYAPLDHAYNATLRLVSELHHIRDLLKECDQILSEDGVFESANEIVQQMGQELNTLEWMIKDLEKWWKPLELSVSEAVGRLRIETPPDSVTWTQHVLDKAWRAWNGMNVQLKIHKDAEKVIRGMISYTPKLEALTCLSNWNQRITKEYRAGGITIEFEGQTTTTEPGKSMTTISKKYLQSLTGLTPQAMTKRYKNGSKWGYCNITETTVDISESAYLALQKARSLRT
jgi:hypothetical protein